MAIALSIAISLIAGITFMFTTQYFWGKEDNSNINTLNCTMTNITNSFGTASSIVMIVIIVSVLAIAVFMCSCRGF